MTSTSAEMSDAEFRRRAHAILRYGVYMEAGLRNERGEEAMALLAAGPGVKHSAVTEHLVAELRSRDAHGQRKYGTTLDRTDLDALAWLQHLKEELLDGAGYAEALKRKLANDPEPLPVVVPDRSVRHDCRHCGKSACIYNTTTGFWSCAGCGNKP